jgi:hypothetical protein
VSTTLVNGVPIETGQTNVGIVDPQHLQEPALPRRLQDRRRRQPDRALLLQRPRGHNAISNCFLGDLYCGGQDLKDTNAALSETHTFSSNVLNEARLSLVKRNLIFPENDAVSPTASISGLFQIGGDSNFPQGRVSDSWQFSDTLTWLKGKHALKIGADIRYNKLDNIARLRLQGHLHRSTACRTT